MTIDEHDDVTTEERRLASLFEQVQAPPAMRRWQPHHGAGVSHRIGGRGSRVRPLAAAAGLAVAVGAVGGLFGTGHLGPSRSGGTAATGAGSGPSPRSGAAMAWDEASHTVILFGGRTQTGNANDTWSWDGSAWHQLSPATSPPARSGALMAADGHGGLVLYGGVGDSGGGKGVPNCVPPVAPGATPAGAPGVPAGVAGVPAESVTLCAAPLSELSDTWTWDGQTWTQQKPAHAPQGVAGVMAFDSGSGSAVLAVHPIPQISAGSAAACAVLVAPPAAPSSGKPVPALPPPPTCPPPAVPVPALPPPFPAGASLWRWTGSDWSSNPGPPSATDVVALATDPAGGLLAVTVSKGSIGAAITAPSQPLPPPVPQITTWHRDAGGSWRQAAVSAASIFGGALATDLDHHQLVGVDAVGKTLLWDGHAWTVSGAPGPGSRGGAALAYDQANQRVVLFGGGTAGGLAGDTWTWDSSRWTRVAGTTPTPGPAPSFLPVPLRSFAPAPLRSTVPVSPVPAGKPGGTP
jgi:hypothetical protein